MQKVSVKIDIPVCYGMRGRASHNTFPRRAWERVKIADRSAGGSSPAKPNAGHACPRPGSGKGSALRENES